jgi:hypothetical protein
MLVMGTNRYPMNQWLPIEPLIPVQGYRTAQVAHTCTTVDDAIVTPGDIAATVDAWYGKDIEQYSVSGKDWAETMSWKVLRTRYIQAVERVELRRVA